MAEPTHHTFWRRNEGRLVTQPDRRALERSGWRTLLEYRENHIRDAGGALVQIVPCWAAEAERSGRRTVVVSATAPVEREAWAQVRRAAADVDRRLHTRSHARPVTAPSKLLAG